MRLSVAVAEVETNQIPADDLLVVRTIHATDAMGTVLQTLKNYMQAHNGQYPAALNDVITSGNLDATKLASDVKLYTCECSQAS